MNHTPASTVAPAPRAARALSPELAAQLDLLLTDLETHHHQQLTLLEAHRAAIARADGDALAHCVLAQQQAAVRLSELDDRRAVLLRAAGAVPGVTLSALCDRAPAGLAAHLRQRATGLRALMTRCVRAQESIALASASLLGHARGLMAQIARRLSETGVYVRPGLAPTAASGAVDVLS